MSDELLGIVFGLGWGTVLCCAISGLVWAYLGAFYGMAVAIAFWTIYLGKWWNNIMKGYEDTGTWTVW